uniref:Uncharacterized protein n=1 Tax=Brassica campestris TaxID=3711 RepID=M4CR02_BRACM
MASKEYEEFMGLDMVFLDDKAGALIFSVNVGPRFIGDHMLNTFKSLLRSKKWNLWMIGARPVVDGPGIVNRVED